MSAAARRSKASSGSKRGALEGPAAGWLDVLHPLDRDRYTLALDGLLHQRSGRINHDLRLRGSDGHYFWYVLKARPVISADGEVVRVIGSLSDVTELKSAEERMLHDAVHDNLTGLPNRELFNDRLGAAILLAQKPGGAAPTVMVIDIDEFQSVNDSYGLSIGDSALLAVARRLARDLRPGDTLARLGGDTFGAIVLAEPQSMDAPARIDALRAALAAPISFGEREIALTVSIGAAQLQPEAARQGRRSSRRRPARARQRQEGRRRPGRDVRRRHALAPHRTGRRSRTTCGARSSAAKSRSCSARSCASRIGPSPGSSRCCAGAIRGSASSTRTSSSSAAESTGAIVDIGAYALEATARELAAWQKALEVNPPIFATVAASSRQMLSHDLLLDVRAALGRHYVQRGSLKLAAAESLVMENPEYAAALLQRVREIGAALMLDRFGAGYTSLGHLPQYRFDAMRIDASLVRPNSFGARSPILRSIVAMAQEIGMEVISEGAETESDAVELAQLGCQFAQGAAFGQPMSAAAARKLMGAAVV